MAHGLEPSDDQLVLLSKDGKLEAFNSLVERHERAVYNLCYRLLGERGVAEDATQEAFLSAYRAIRRFDGGNVRSWFLRIAANECKDELRRRQRRVSSSLEAMSEGRDTPFDLPDASAGAPEIAELHEFGAAFQQLLLQLPYDQRQAVLLVDVYEYRYEEVAEITGDSLGTVKSRIHRGREKLRALLAGRPELFGAVGRLEGEKES
jgi:RNA polymerase sigma-70 factor (ECF subfamily)